MNYAKRMNDYLKQQVFGTDLLMIFGKRNFLKIIIRQ